MKIAEVKKLLDSKLRGDNAEYELDEVLLYEALINVLIRTRPRTHIVRETETLKHLFKYFRRISISDEGRNNDEKVAYWLRYPYIDLADSANLDMEEELSLAVVYFLCAELSNQKKAEYKAKAEEIIAIYDTNINWRKTPRFLNAYFYVRQDSGGLTPSNPSGGGGTDNPSGGDTPSGGGGSDTPSVIPILRNVVIEVGESVEIIVDNANGGTITASSDTEALEVSVSGDIVTITALDETEQGFVTITNGSDSFRVEVYAAEGDGGFI